MTIIPFQEDGLWIVDLLGFRMRFDHAADADQYAAGLTRALTETGKEVLKAAEPLVAACRRIVEAFDAADSWSGNVDVYRVSAVDAARLRSMVRLYDNHQEAT